MPSWPALEVVFEEERPWVSSSWVIGLRRSER
jgi:hypothetical protein